MEKFSHISKITKEHLDGNLIKFSLEYTDADTAYFTVYYEDYDQYSFIYQTKINNSAKTLDFFHHHCTYSRDRIEIRSFKSFETAIGEYLFTK